MSRPRYIVSSVTGYNIPSGWNAQEVTDYLVLDTECCHRVVAELRAPPKGKPSAYMRKIKADELAAALNRADEAWRDALARDAELTA